MVTMMTTVLPRVPVTVWGHFLYVLNFFFWPTYPHRHSHFLQTTSLIIYGIYPASPQAWLRYVTSLTGTCPLTQRMPRMVSCGGTRDAWHTLVYHAWLGIISQFLVSSVFSPTVNCYSQYPQQWQLMMNMFSVKDTFCSPTFTAISLLNWHAPFCALASGVCLALSRMVTSRHALNSTRLLRKRSSHRAGMILPLHRVWHSNVLACTLCAVPLLLVVAVCSCSNSESHVHTVHLECQCCMNLSCLSCLSQCRNSQVQVVNKPTIACHTHCPTCQPIKPIPLIKGTGLCRYGYG